MNNPLHTVTQHIENGIILEVCYGKIPEIFRQLHFGPITEFELPDTKATNSEFQDWLIFYSKAKESLWVEQRLMEMAKCS